MRGVAAAGLLLALFALVPASARAEVFAVAPGGSGLADALARAQPGDTLRLEPGRHAGGVTVGMPLTLEGLNGAIVEGDGAGNVITVAAPDVTVRGLIVRGSGVDLSTMNSGVYVGETGTRARIENNRIEENLFGVYLQGPADAVVADNVIVGRSDLRVNERGNGVQIWRSPGSAVLDNDISLGRDGIFVTNSGHNRFEGNSLSGLRYGIHYMYTHDSTIARNVTTNTRAGFALMFSDRLEVRDNLSIDDRQYGLFLNSANSSVVTGNRVRYAGEKCAHVYNSSKNEIRGNDFEGCAVGIHFTAGSERNRIFENAFVANATQVKYDGTRDHDWSVDGRGNYWSDNPAFDLDGNGIADAAYRPNDLIDQVVWDYPLAKLLLTSPAVQTLRWAQAQFPTLHPGGVIDSAPLMRRPGPGA